MDEINTASFTGKEGVRNLNPIDLLGSEKSLMDMEGFETLDISANNASALGNDPCDGKDSFDDLIGNLQSSGLVSTTRPLVTTSEEEVSVLSRGISPSLPTSDSPDYVNVDSGSSLVDINADSRVEGSFGDSVSELQGSGDGVLIDEDTQHQFGDSEILKSATSTGGTSSILFDKVLESEIEETLPKVKDPKIGTKPIAESEKYKSESGACEPIAQPAPVKSEVAMEAETIGNASKNCEADCPFSPGAWFNPEKLHPIVAEYVYWRDPKKSGIAFGATLVLLLSLKYFSLISVVAYLTLALLSVTVSFRIYKNVLQAVQKSNEGHPFKEFLDMDIALSQDKVNQTIETLIHHVNCVTGKLRSLVLVEDLFDTLKLAVLAWCLTYVGAWFNGMTLVILALVSAFTLPKVYETNKAQIDVYAEILRTKGKELIEMVNAKMPMGKKKKEQ